jgi:hypothetical protein
MAITFAIVLAFTAAVLVARGRYITAIVLAVLALPVFVFAARRARRDRGG